MIHIMLYSFGYHQAHPNIQRRTWYLLWCFCLQSKYLFLKIKYFFSIQIAKNEKDNNRTRSGEQQKRKSPDRPSKYIDVEECINRNTLKQCQRKRQVTRIKHLLQTGDRSSQLYLLNLLSTQIILDDVCIFAKNFIESYQAAKSLTWTHDNRSGAKPETI